ncbi:hypothetical protein CDCA_CDCA07G2125 [Cyanidium caldarium]|uniref:HEAT repeat domain-containing protein n=1 Tax=Cyanidium caldarium TaxID=2771 RepID=A0AAV9IVH9_CYACA|nr:hypothetical protein CDCA_CDCA07G2125 [Cyanidium caldarium]
MARSRASVRAAGCVHETEYPLPVCNEKARRSGCWRVRLHQGKRWLHLIRSERSPVRGCLTGAFTIGGDLFLPVRVNESMKRLPNQNSALGATTPDGRSAFVTLTVRLHGLNARPSGRAAACTSAAAGRAGVRRARVARSTRELRRLRLLAAPSRPDGPRDATNAARSGDTGDSVEIATPFGVATREVLALPARVLTVLEQRGAAGGIPCMEERFEAVVVSVRRGDVRSRLAAMQEAIFYPSAAVVPLLIEVLLSSLCQKREREQLEQVAPAEPLQSRVEILRSVSAQHRTYEELSRSQAAFSLALVLGRPSNASLMDRLRDDVREDGVNAMLDTLEHDPDPPVRAAVAGAVGHIGGRVQTVRQRAIPPLLRRFVEDNEDWIVRLSAAVSLGMLQAHETLSELVKELERHTVRSESGTSLFVQSVVGCVGEIGAVSDRVEPEWRARAVDALCRYAGSNQRMVLVAVAEALGRWAPRSQQALEALRHLADSADSTVAEQARISMAAAETEKPGQQRGVG